MHTAGSNYTVAAIPEYTLTGSRKVYARLGNTAGIVIIAKHCSNEINETRYIAKPLLTIRHIRKCVMQML